MTALLMFGGFALLLILGVPIALSLGVSTMAAIAGSPDITVSINTVAQRIFGGLDSTSIMAIAFFVLSGNLMTKGGISRRICEFARSIIGGVRGGMALTLVLACAFFAALSGSAPATVVAIGTMLYGDMVRMGYPGDRTAGLLVVSGGLGPIIPPSIIMVVYATITGASVGDMFKSGMGIGIGIMALSGMGLWVFAPALMGIFTADAAVIALGARVLRIEAFAEPMFGASIVASGAMQGAGDSTACFVLNLVSMWGIRLTLASFFAPRFGLAGVWGSMCCELCIRGLLFLFRLARGKWLEKGALT